MPDQRVDAFVCGIAGAVIPQGLSGMTAKAMQDALAHRGPDDQGWWADDGRARAGKRRIPTAPLVLLHRRLTILDLSARGHQPMTRGPLTIVYNGEVYNYRELRDELAARGHTFNSDTDTEVVLAAWQEWGAAALGRFVGMFAFALHDAQARGGEGEVVLARDAFGIKPLHYARVDGGTVFASTPEAILMHPGVPRQADSRRVAAYLAGIPDDAGTATFFAAIRQVPPGHLVRVGRDGQTAHPERHTDLRPTPFTGSIDEAAARLRALVLESVRLHLRSDVPLGIALSGGIDSSGIAAAARDAHEGPLTAIGYVPDDHALSEEAWIDQAAAHVDARVTKVAPTPDLDALVSSQGEPTVSTSPLAQAAVFAAAHEAGIKVMLSGQGADELFGGYVHHVAARAAALLRRGRFVAAGRLVRRLRAHGAGLDHVAAALMPTLADKVRARGAQAPWLRLDQLPRVEPRRLRGERLQAVLADARRTNLPMLLRYEDRSAMACSVESRVPYLTPELARFAASLPPEYLVGPDGTTKRVLRLALRGLVPDAILDRPDKVGFATTEAAWLRQRADWVTAALAGPMPAFLDGDALRSHWADVQAGAAPRDGFWRAVCLLQWAKHFDVAWD